jgi:hypothetical protein
MFKLGKNKRLILFNKLFREVPPREFAILFNFEFAQTKAFVLSFSPRKSYIKKVLGLLGEREAFVIRECLNRCQETNFNIDFARAVDKEIERMIVAEYGDFHRLRKLRKKFVFKHQK